MKKPAIVIAVAILAAGVSHADETADGQDSYGRGLSYLAAVQNTDGSWGAGTDRVYATAFAVVAFLSHGETPASTEYGTNVERSLKWLVRQSPSNDLDRVSVIHALTAGYRMTRIRILGVEATRQRSRVDPESLAEPSATLFRITLPPDAPSGNRVSTNDALRHFVALPTGPLPLRAYLQTLAVFVDGGPKWQEYNKGTLGPLIATQSADGSFPLADARSSIESTAFALLRISVYYRYWMDYLDIGEVKRIRGGATARNGQQDVGRQ